MGEAYGLRKYIIIQAPFSRAKNRREEKVKKKTKRPTPLLPMAIPPSLTIRRNTLPQISIDIAREGDGAKRCVARQQLKPRAAADGRDGDEAVVGSARWPSRRL